MKTWNSRVKPLESAGTTAPRLAANVSQSVLTIQAWEFPALAGAGLQSQVRELRPCKHIVTKKKQTLVIYKNTECNRIL